MKLRPFSTLEIVQFMGVITSIVGIATAVGIAILLGVMLVVLGLAVWYVAGRLAIRAEALLRERLEQIRDAIRRYKATEGTWPPSLRELVKSGYLAALPPDPVRWPWRTWDEIRTTGGDGVIDVHSRSHCPSLDDTAYSEW